MNYSINEDLLDLECFKDLQRGNKTATLVVLSFICHWIYISKKPTALVYMGRLADTWSVKQPTIAKAIKHLEDCGLIKCVKPWQRVGSKPGEYVVLDKKGYIPVVTGLYTRSNRAIVSKDTVNNYNNNYNKNDYGFTKPNPSLKVGSMAWILAEEKKQKEKGI